MNIKIEIDWNSMDWQQYNHLLFGAHAQVDEAKLSHLPPNFSGWNTGVLILLPVKITQNGEYTDIDVMGEIVEVLYIDTVSSPYNVRLTVKMLKPYTL
jgi:hypothetical protein